jgi:hypothetical protein
MPVDIRLLATDKIDKVLHFFNSAQSDSVRSFFRPRKEFDWLFLKGFFKPAIYVVAADMETGEVIGTTAGIYIPVKTASGDRMMSLKSEDTLISLDHMIKLGKRDLLKEMMNIIEEQARSENVSFIWGLTTAANSYKRIGYNVNCQVKSSFFVAKPLRFYKYRIEQFPGKSINERIQLFGFSWYNYFRQLLLSMPSSQFIVKQVSLDEIDEKILLSFLPDNMLTIHLTKEFLKWRISENPSSMTYAFLEIRNKESLIMGYLIYSYNKDNIYFVEQFLFRVGLPDKIKVKIMSNLFSFIKKQNVIAIRAYGFVDNNLNMKDIRLLKRSGFYFFTNKRSSYFIFKNLTDQTMNAKDIYLSRLYTLGTV